jgi:acetyltransferase
MMHCVMNQGDSMSGEVVHSFYSKDKQRLDIRPLRPEDAPYLVNLFEHMGAESRFLRFNVALTNPDPELVWTEARRLARIDPDKDGAWLVFTDLPDQPDAPVAAARYVRIDPETAEASLAVRDDMQRKGIGTELLRFLAEQARRAGIRRLTATIQRVNRPLFYILQKADLAMEVKSEGSYTTIVVELTAPEKVL